MFGFDWPELIVIGVVALIFIGPEDLPDMFRQLGRFTAKLRQMSREFSRAMEQAAKETGVSDVARDLKASTSASSLGLDKVREAADKFEKWDPMKNVAKPTVTMPARSQVLPVVLPPALRGPEDAVADEVDDDLAAVAEADAAAAVTAVDATPAVTAAPAEAPGGHGPATQALYDKQALRAQVLQEQTEKLKAIEAGTYAAAPVVAAPEPAGPAEADQPAPRKRSPKRKAETAGDAGADLAAADTPPKASRKKKADNA